MHNYEVAEENRTCRERAVEQLGTLGEEAEAMQREIATLRKGLDESAVVKRRLKDAVEAAVSDEFRVQWSD